MKISQKRCPSSKFFKNTPSVFPLVVINCNKFLHLSKATSPNWLGSYTVAVSGLCIASVQFLTQSQSATVYCICTIFFLSSASRLTYFFLVVSSSSSSPFLLLSHNLFLLLPHAWLDFDQTWSEWTSGWVATKVINIIINILKGHVGVTGVKKVIFTKNVSTHLNYVARSRDSFIFISFLLSTQVINHRSIRGHLGSQGSKTRSNYKQLQMTNVTVSMCWCWANMYKCPR